jgi:hypothetical protein
MNMYIFKDEVLLKVLTLKDQAKNNILFSNFFGPMEQQQYLNKKSQYIKSGYVLKKFQEEFSLNVNRVDNKIQLTSLANCQVLEKDQNTFEVQANRGIFKVKFNFDINQAISAEISDNINYHRDDKKVTALLIAFTLVFFGLLFYVINNPAPIEKPLEEKKVEPVVVNIVKPPAPVVVPKEEEIITEIKTATKEVKRAVVSNLSFLGVVGNNKKSKVLGGLRTKLQNVTDGAGSGGDAGSGGEVVSGVGAGLTKITVGNTGVAGLGGVGTKGRGGGAGGYGDVSIASGSGIGLTKVKIGNEMTIEGGLDKNIIAATIAKYLNQVRSCYEMGLAKNENLQGQVSIHFIINGQGQVMKNNVIDTSLKDPIVEKCILQKNLTWIFPKPRGGVNVDVNYPFVLKPVQSI